MNPQAQSFTPQSEGAGLGVSFKNPGRSPAKKNASWRKKDNYWGYLFLGPQTIGLAIFTLIPFVMMVGLSFSSWDGLGPISWVGLTNFKSQLHDPLLWRSITNTLTIGFITAPVGLLIALVLAVAIQQLRLRTLYLLMFFAPIVTNTIAVATIWQQILRKDSLLNTRVSHLFGFSPPDWLFNPHLALIAVCIVIIWGSLGLNVVIFLAGLESISPSVIEAARIDGAGPVQIFTKIRIPLLSPVIFFSIIVAVISSMQTFDVVYVLTSNGGPQDSTRTLVYHIYDLGFVRNDFGGSSAAALILLVLSLFLTLTQFAFQKRFVHYDS